MMMSKSSYCYRWVLAGMLLFSMQVVAQSNQVTPALPSAKGKTLQLPYTQMALTAKLMGVAVSDSNWFNWCVSPIQGKDGKIHIFGSRWPAVEGDGGWTGRNAEIAHFVADKPEGPFRFVNTVLKTTMFPDSNKMWAPHNPRLEYVDGKYMLLYIFQTEKNAVKMSIGMMIADKLEGPWRFAGHDNGLMAASSKDTSHWTYNSVIGIDNPAFLKIGKKYYIYFKSGTPKQLAARYGYAVAERLEGPYTLSDQPLTDNVSYTEDAQAFTADGKYYLLTTDNLGGNTGVYGNLILWQSASGTAFKLKDARIAMGNILDYWGTAEDHKKLLNNPAHYEHDPSGKLERPAVLFMNGKPAYFYSTAGLNITGGKMSETYVFKIDWNKGL
jgi:hypothetical protein